MNGIIIIFVIIIIKKEEKVELTDVTTPSSNDAKVLRFSDFLSKGAENLVDLTQFK